MTQYIAFLRGINVGGNTKVSMKDLAALCADIGFDDVRTYINSGNIIFKSNASAASCKKKLETALHKKYVREIGVAVRTDAEVKDICKRNPFPKGNPSQVGVLLMNDIVPKNALAGMVNDGPEEVKASKSEIFIHFPLGMGRTKLKLPSTIGSDGTMRNINTMTKLMSMTRA